ncbi:hypothetical protein DAEQUDRAFT_804751 [Daedalea quercina L-15889]|uniref:MYND-type domain-containing protein n=1 Tax=Daedalea quercina L-15889 TaxID=1314783 RepID=A0A165SXK3_9APHY|nr:hypothetical protein DAEQUDRAFT_804751 [Daedalea quercina L-15889]
MNKRMGAESLAGFGGGMVSQESQKSLTTAEDLCRKRRPEEAVPYLLKAMKDPNNLDADIQFCFLQPNLGMSMQVLEAAEQKGVGIIQTRPYMRVLQTMVRIAFEKGDYNKSANTMIEMLRLCPGDNMGQRSWHGSVLLQAGRHKEALSFAQAWLQPETRRTGAPPPRGGCAFDAPSPDPIPQAEYQSMSEYCDAELLYTGALAAFKIWGPEGLLARQYLRLGTKSNPTILMRILGKVTRPHSLNNMPRSLNGTEEAHDYCWLTQNLWEEPDRRHVLKFCSREACGRREQRVAEFKRCSACKQVSYCSLECQETDWKAHKPDCKAHQERKAFSRAMMF